MLIQTLAIITITTVIQFVKYKNIYNSYCRHKITYIRVCVHACVYALMHVRRKSKGIKKLNSIHQKIYHKKLYIVGKHK